MSSCVSYRTARPISDDWTVECQYVVQRKRTNLINEARIKASISRFDSGAYTRMQSLRAVSHSVGAHAVPEDCTADSDAEDDQVHNDSDSVSCQWTAVAGFMRGVTGSAAWHTTCFRAVRALQRFCASALLSFSNKLAVAQYAALTSAWSCVCTIGSDMLLKLTMYCLRTIRTVFLSLRFALFSIYFNNLMIIPTTCVCLLVLLQTTTFVKIQRNRSIKTAESKHTENTLVNAKQIVQLLLTTVSNDEKPMSFLHYNISFGTLIRKQTFHTRLSRIFRSRIFSRPASIMI